MTRVPEYVLIDRMECELGAHDKRVLESGTFMKPIEIQYVPAHIKAAPFRLYWPDKSDSYYERRRDYDKAIDVFCYCHFRFVLVRRSALRKV